VQVKVREENSIAHIIIRMNESAIKMKMAGTGTNFMGLRLQVVIANNNHGENTNFPAQITSQIQIIHQKQSQGHC
jgi:hypothetical protein